MSFGLSTVVRKFGDVINQVFPPSPARRGREQLSESVTELVDQGTKEYCRASGVRT